MLVSLKIIKILRNFKINNLKIKWPNDILADNKKICGILIESFLKKNRVKDVVIGFGINVNQFDFGALKNATSFFLIKKTFQDLYPLSKAIIKEFSDFNYEVINKTTSELKLKYLKSLYGLNIYNKFNVSENIINAKIVDVRAEGQLVLEIDGVKKEFINQQIKYIN
jgi:BirA family biotin operon repressor/biotin-[acetyl-CoA-carboxylase] ligase